MRYDLNSFALIFSVLISVFNFSSTSFADISVKKPKQLIGIFKAVDGSALSLDGKIYKLFFKASLLTKIYINFIK